MGDIECVAEGCGFSADTVGSVEAHISGKTDEQHVGNGMMYRDELVAQKEEKLNKSAGAGAEGSSEAPAEAPEPNDEQAEGSGSGEGAPASVAGAAPAVAGAGLLGSFGVDSGGSKVPVLLGVLVLALLVLAVASSEPEADQEEQEPEASSGTEAVEQRGGLRG